MSHGKDDVGPLVSLLAGGIAGGVEATITYPFEFAKTRVQLKSDGTVYSKNPYRVLSTLIKTEGLPAIYKGCTSMITGSIGKDAIRFLTFSRIRALFTPTDGILSPARSLAAGMASGVVASTLAVTPSERIKTALIDDARSPGARSYHGPLHTARTLITTGGVRSLWAGWTSTTAKQMGTSGVRLGSYNVLRDLGRARGWGEGGVLSFAQGAVAGTVTTLVTQPFDVVKTRVQGKAGEKTMEAVRNVLQEYGVRGLWRGTVMRLGRTLPAGGILFMAYEAATGVLSRALPV